jgi:purine-binding chemotaxis protein CheW
MAQGGVIVTHSTSAQYVTGTVGEHLFGIPIARARGVFRVDRITPVPLAPPAVAGMINLRGRIVTIVDMCVRLGVARRSDGQRRMAIGVESSGELYGFLVDDIGDVLALDDDARERLPPNFDKNIADIATGVHAIERRLLVLVDVDRVLDLNGKKLAA